MSNIKTQTQDILTKHGLDFTIEKAPMVAINKLGEQVPSPYFGLINSKSNEVINTVKEGYTVSQNEDIVEMVLRGMERFGDKLTVSKAGSLNGGRKVFMQLAIEGMSKVGDDVIKRYVTIIDSNDGSISLSIGIGDECMRCLNQFYKFYKAGDAKFRHTATLEQKLRTIPTLIETSLSVGIKQIELYNYFVSTPLTKNLADKMVKHVLGYDRQFTSMDVLSSKSTRAINIMDKLYSDINTEIEQAGNNVWSLFGGITRFTTHSNSTPNRENGRSESLIIGNGYNMNQKALDFCLTLV